MSMNRKLARFVKDGKALAALRQLAAGQDLSNTVIDFLRALGWVSLGSVTRVYEAAGPRRILNRPTITHAGREALASGPAGAG
jgi:hypothetical protein